MAKKQPKSSKQKNPTGTYLQGGTTQLFVGIFNSAEIIYSTVNNKDGLQKKGSKILKLELQVDGPQKHVDPKNHIAQILIY